MDDDTHQVQLDPGVIQEHFARYWANVTRRIETEHELDDRGLNLISYMSGFRHACATLTGGDDADLMLGVFREVSLLDTAATMLAKAEDIMRGGEDG